MACSIEHTLHRGHLVPIILAAIFIFAVPVQGIAETYDKYDDYKYSYKQEKEQWVL